MHGWLHRVCGMWVWLRRAGVQCAHGVRHPVGKGKMHATDATARGWGARSGAYARTPEALRPSCSAKIWNALNTSRSYHLWGSTGLLGKHPTCRADGWKLVLQVVHVIAAICSTPLYDKPTTGMHTRCSTTWQPACCSFQHEQAASSRSCTPCTSTLRRCSWILLFCSAQATYSAVMAGLAAAHALSCSCIRLAWSCRRGPGRGAGSSAASSSPS